MSASSFEAFGRVLTFEVWGDYALFKRFYTTASPLSFAVPPPTSLAGILGAIAGSGKRDYMRDFGPDNCRIALRLVNPLKKTRLGLNWVNSSSETDPYFRSGVIAAHNPVLVELLKDPRYRVYVSLSDPEQHARLRDLLRTGQSVYTISLGPANLLASLQFIGEELLLAKPEGKYSLSTIVPVTSVRWPAEGQGDGKGITFESAQATARQPHRFIREHLPRRMESDRRVTEYVDVIVETGGRSFEVDLTGAYGAGDETIVFL